MTLKKLFAALLIFAFIISATACRDSGNEGEGDEVIEGGSEGGSGNEGSDEGGSEGGSGNEGSDEGGNENEDGGENGGGEEVEDDTDRDTVELPPIDV